MPNQAERTEAGCTTASQQHRDVLPELVGDDDLLTETYHGPVDPLAEGERPTRRSSI